MPRKIDRRKLLSGLTMSSSAIAIPGLVSANEHSEEESVEISDLDSTDLLRIQSKIRHREDVRLLMRRAKEMGWSPKWRETRGTRKTIETDIVTGRYDTVVVPFKNIQAKDNDATVFLTWNGNNTFDLDGDTHPAFRYINSGATLTYLDGRISEVAKLGDIDAREYRVNDGKISEKTLSDVLSTQDDGTVVSSAGLVGPDSESSSVERNSNEYCEIHVKLFDPGVGLLSCATLECLNVNLGASAVTILGCATAAGIFGAVACLGATFFTSYNVIDCFACDHSDAVVELEVDWLEDNFMALEGDPHPCYVASPAGPSYIPMTKCELEDAPTREEYNYAECD
ncbi:hypothetical protein [Natrarchaeobius chitinivorans]|uniref:hypothetical protein n=1 Tax=Natrarchaeobius chitinivorans TaxID=1679083 RepID=UPI000F540D5B|nr:hypothetical protein [Natrarchaeobius chitinivorans]